MLYLMKGERLHRKGREIKPVFVMLDYKQVTKFGTHLFCVVYRSNTTKISLHCCKETCLCNQDNVRHCLYQNSFETKELCFVNTQKFCVAMHLAVLLQFERIPTSIHFFSIPCSQLEKKKRNMLNPSRKRCVVEWALK